MNLKILIASFLCMAIIGTANAQSSKKKSYNFNVESGSVLSINNSFGDIDIEEFDEGKILVYVEIIVEAKNDKNTEEFLDKIYIDAKEKGNTVSLKTVNDLKGMRVKNFEVNYTVKIPKNTGLEIVNTFGDVKVQSASGKVYLTVQHGDCFLGNSKGDDNVLKVDFGDLRVIETGNINVISKHGDVNLGSVADLKLNTQFSDTKIQNIRGDATVDIQHGDFRIDNVGSKVQYINLNAQFSDIEIEGLNGKDFKVNLDGSFTDFDFDDNWHVTLSKKDYNVEGYVLYTNGNEASATKTLRIKAQHSDVDLE